MGVPKQIVDLLRNAGIEKPSVAQLAALPELIDLRKLGGEGEEDAKAWSVSMPSIAMQSHTGSGKTLAYLIPIFCDILREEEAMEKMDRNQKRHVNDVRAMIVVPSQELAMQIVRTIETVLGPYGRDITQQLIGGANARRQEQGLRKKRPFIVVGTPGRIAEMSRMGVLKTHGVSTLVIDEADDLLESNFRRDMARINEHCGKGVKGGRRTIICSATLRKETLDAYAYRTVAFGFPVWTFAVIMGAIWAEQSWGRYWGWDPKETSAFLTWVAYAGYLHARATRGMKGRNAGWLGILAFAVLMFTYFAVNLVVVGLHSYA